MKKNMKKKPTVHKEASDNPRSHSSKAKSCSMKAYTWKITSFVLLALLIVSAIFLFSGNNIENNIENTCDLKSGEETGVFLKSAFQLPELNLMSSVDERSLCLHTYQIEGNDVEIYTSYDGEIIFIPGLEPINKSTYNLGQEKEVQELQKLDKPVVELFVMSHCPYGTQFEKGILPVVDLLGNSIDFEIKFVNYIMHDMIEIEEQLLQYCVQEDSKEVYKDYLYCFLEDGDTDRCLEKTGITKESLNECISQTDQAYNIMGSYEDKESWLSGVYPKFLIHDEDNKKYGVQGSPTLVINGSVVNSSRDSQSILNSICNGFEEKPSACDQSLSTDNPSAGFGFQGVSTTSSDATCG